MKKNEILVLLLSLSLVFFYSCKHPSGTDLPNDPSAPESPADPENPGDPADPAEPEKLPDPETGVIIITAKEENDFAVTKSDSNGKVVLTAAQGYSDYKWYLDADFTVKSENAEYSFVPANGVTMVFVTAKKDGVQCSATYYVTKK